MLGLQRFDDILSVPYRHLQQSQQVWAMPGAACTHAATQLILVDFGSPAELMFGASIASNMLLQYSGAAEADEYPTKLPEGAGAQGSLLLSHIESALNPGAALRV